MDKKVIITFLIALLAGSTLLGVTAYAEGKSTGKITICHVTKNEKNPWVKINVSEKSIPAHEEHGDIPPTPEGECVTPSEDPGDGTGDDGTGDDGDGTDPGDGGGTPPGDLDPGSIIIGQP